MWYIPLFFKQFVFYKKFELITNLYEVLYEHFFSLENSTQWTNDWITILHKLITYFYWEFSVVPILSDTCHI
jgi:hypothetical protein